MFYYLFFLGLITSPWTFFGVRVSLNTAHVLDGHTEVLTPLCRTVVKAWQEKFKPSSGLHLHHYCRMSRRNKCSHSASPAWRVQLHSARDPENSNAEAAKHEIWEMFDLIICSTFKFARQTLWNHKTSCRILFLSNVNMFICAWCLAFYSVIILQDTQTWKHKSVQTFPWWHSGDNNNFLPTINMTIKSYITGS